MTILETMMRNDPEKALRLNEGKPELSYILSMPRALVALSWVFARGAVKYL